MSTFYERVIKPAQDAEAYVAEKGGLPEITAAAHGLTVALDQTREEILGATFASRFLREPNDMLRSALDDGNLSPTTRHAVEAEGEAGLKRSELLTRHTAICSDITHALSHLVELRAELVISQEEF